MKVGDKVQYCGYDTLGATGEIIREKEKTLYYSKWEREGDDRYCMCYLVRYTMPNGKTINNVARPEDLKLLENEEWAPRFITTKAVMYVLSKSMH